MGDVKGVFMMIASGRQKRYDLNSHLLEKKGKEGGSRGRGRTEFEEEKVENK